MADGEPASDWVRTMCKPCASGVRPGCYLPPAVLLSTKVGEHKPRFNLVSSVWTYGRVISALRSRQAAKHRRLSWLGVRDPWACNVARPVPAKMKHLAQGVERWHSPGPSCSQLDAGPSVLLEEMQIHVFPKIRL